VVLCASLSVLLVCVGVLGAAVCDVFGVCVTGGCGGVGVTLLGGGVCCVAGCWVGGLVGCV